MSMLMPIVRDMPGETKKIIEVSGIASDCARAIERLDDIKREGVGVDVWSTC